MLNPLSTKHEYNSLQFVLSADKITVSGNEMSVICKCNFHPLEVVGRDSETQLQVGEHLNWIT